MPLKLFVHCYFGNPLRQRHLRVQFPQMARIRPIANLITHTSSEACQDTVTISEAMRASSLFKPAKELPRDRPSKSSYIEIGCSILKEKDLHAMKKLGYLVTRSMCAFLGKKQLRVQGKTKLSSIKPSSRLDFGSRCTN